MKENEASKKFPYFLNNLFLSKLSGPYTKWPWYHSYLRSLHSLLIAWKSYHMETWLSRHQKAYIETGSIRFAVSDIQNQYVLTSGVLPAFQGLTGVVRVGLQHPVASYMHCTAVQTMWVLQHKCSMRVHMHSATNMSQYVASIKVCQQINFIYLLTAQC